MYLIGEIIIWIYSFGVELEVVCRTIMLPIGAQATHSPEEFQFIVGRLPFHKETFLFEGFDLKSSSTVQSVSIGIFSFIRIIVAIRRVRV